jgi:hypothetical protein
MKNGTQSLDERIVDILRPDADHQSSATLAALTAEVEAAISEADETARVNRERAYDPTILDPVARGKSDDATFVAHRLRAGLERLKQLLGAAVTREAEARWNVEAEALKNEVAEIAAYFKKTYMETAGHLVGVLEKMASIDLRVDALNSRAPTGVNWLRRTEAVARGIPRISGKPFVMQIQLPKMLMFDTPDAAPLAWPPAAVNHALEYYHAVSAAITHAPPPPTDAERIAASERQMEYVAQQERGREQKNAEAAAGRPAG